MGRHPLRGRWVARARRAGALPPLLGSPTQTKPTVATPAGDGGGGTSPAGVRRRSGPASPNRGRLGAGKSRSAISACVPVGCSRNSNSVTTPKLPPPPRSPQNRSAFSSGCAHDVAGGGDHARRTPRCRRPARAAGRASPCRRRGSARRHRCATRCPRSWPARRAGSPVERAEQRAALDPGAPAVRVHPDAAERREVDHQAVLGHGQADHAVPAAAHADLETCCARRDRDDDVRRRRHARSSRPPVDHHVPHRAGRVVPSNARTQDLGLGHGSLHFLGAVSDQRHDQNSSLTLLTRCQSARRHLHHRLFALEERQRPLTCPVHHEEGGRHDPSAA